MKELSRCNQRKYSTNESKLAEKYQMSTHKNFKKNCAFCCYSTSCQYDLKVHLNRVHDKVRNNFCDQCDSSFTTQGGLNRHKGEVHGELGRKKCGECNYSSVSNFCLKRHLLNVHKTWLCMSCNFHGKNLLDLQDHALRTHQTLPNVKTHTCMLCKFSGYRKCDLTKHVKLVHRDINDRVQCTMCTKRFSEERHLALHITTQHEQIYNFLCVPCNKGYQRSRDLDRHIQLKHDPFKEIFCTKCKYRTNSQLKMKKHVNKHKNSVHKKWIEASSKQENKVSRVRRRIPTTKLHGNIHLNTNIRCNEMNPSKVSINGENENISQGRKRSQNRKLGLEADSNSLSIRAEGNSKALDYSPNMLSCPVIECSFKISCLKLLNIHLFKEHSLE